MHYTDATLLTKHLTELGLQTINKKHKNIQ